MKRALILVPLVLGGCGLPQRVTQPGGWEMPEKMNPMGMVEGGVQTTFVFGTGFVRGTSETLAGFGKPLPGHPGPNRTVDACAAAVQGEAAKKNAREVHVASGGPEVKNPDGSFTAPVRFRVLYPRMFGLDVRERVLICTTTGDGNLLGATEAR